MPPNWKNPTRQYSGRIRPPPGGMKQLSWEVGKKTALDPKKNSLKNLKIWVFSCFFHPNSGKFSPVLAISHNWGRENPKFLGFALFLVNIRGSSLSRREKSGKKTDFSGTGDGERNRIYGQNIDGWKIPYTRSTNKLEGVGYRGPVGRSTPKISGPGRETPKIITPGRRRRWIWYAIVGNYPTAMIEVEKSWRH